MEIGNYEWKFLNELSYLIYDGCRFFHLTESKKKMLENDEFFIEMGFVTSKTVVSKKNLQLLSKFTHKKIKI